MSRRHMLMRGVVLGLALMIAGCSSAGSGVAEDPLASDAAPPKTSKDVAPGEPASPGAPVSVK